jgi:hypothetical protein
MMVMASRCPEVDLGIITSAHLLLTSVSGAAAVPQSAFAPSFKRLSGRPWFVVIGRE